MAILEKLKSVLAQSFPPPDEVKLKDDDGTGVVGVVVSRRFRRLSTHARLKKLESVLEKSLAPEELKQIVILVAVTPEEQKDNPNWVD